MEEDVIVRFYSAALGMLPEDVRARHGAQMALVFGELVQDARRHQGWRGALRALIYECGALLWFVFCEHRGRPLPRRIDERMLAWPSETKGRVPVLSSLLQDVRYAARMLWRTPGFTVVCVSTMALAIGANTALFSIVRGILLKPLPFADPERVVILGNRTDGSPDVSETTPGNIYDWQARATGFSTMAGFAYREQVLTWNGNADRVLGLISIGSIFDVVGRRAAEGRTFTGPEDGPGSPRVVVLSYGLARRLFVEGGAVGQSLGIGGETFTVIGVMPPDFTFPDHDVLFWTPARFEAQFRANRDQYFLYAVARLGPGVSMPQAQQQLDSVMDGIRREFPQYAQNATAGIVATRDILVQNARARILILMGAVAFLLLISCANLGNLLLARASTRRREMALRHALGARPLRLVRQMLTESLLLSALGGIAGIAVGALLMRLLLSWLSDDLPRVNEVSLDPYVLAFTAAVSLVSGLGFGLFPALQLAGRATAGALREGTRGSGQNRVVRTGLVVSEVALALVLLAGAGLLVRSFANLVRVHPGFPSDRLLTLSISVPTTVYKEASERSAFFDAAFVRLSRLPGVQGAALASTLPVGGRGSSAWFNLVDRPVLADQTPPLVPYRVVSPNFFSVLEIPVTRGRSLREDDRLEGTRAVVVSESLARRFWHGKDPIGQHIYLGPEDNRLFPDGEVVGVVADVKQRGLDEASPEAVYIPRRLMPLWNGFSVALRTSLAPMSLATAARGQIRALDPDVPVTRVRTMEEVIARSVAPTRSSMLLVGLFAGLALFLAVIGVFGVLSYTVNQQRAELGIRLALGATGLDVKLLVLRQGMLPVAMGVVLGLGGAVALSRSMESVIFGVTSTDPGTFGTVAAALIAVAAVASYLPARGATRVDPAVVLRQH